MRLGRKSSSSKREQHQFFSSTRTKLRRESPADRPETNKFYLYYFTVLGKLLFSQMKKGRERTTFDSEARLTHFNARAAAGIDHNRRTPPNCCHHHRADHRGRKAAKKRTILVEGNYRLKEQQKFWHSRHSQESEGTEKHGRCQSERHSLGPTPMR